MKQKKQYNVYAPQIVGGRDLQRRVSRISELTGKKNYQIVKEAMEIGLAQIESVDK
jgi:predicted DNA-binding protein